MTDPCEALRARSFLLRLIERRMKMRLKEKERPKGLLVWLALQVAFIYIYIVGRFSSVHHGCIREISRQDVYTDISFKRETHYLRWPSFFNTLSDQKELALTPTLVFNKPETRIVKLNLNCIIIQSVSLPRFLSFSPRIYKFEFPSSILSSLNNPSSTFVPSARNPGASPIFPPFSRIGVYTRNKRKRKRDYKLAGDTSTHPPRNTGVLKAALFGQK